MAVLNKHKLPGKATPAGAVYIGRGSKWGNPFVIGVHGTRDEVCDKYEQLLDECIRDGEVSITELFALYGKDLVCFCAPARCHGHTLEQKASWAAAQLDGFGL